MPNLTDPSWWYMRTLLGMAATAVYVKLKARHSGEEQLFEITENDTLKTFDAAITDAFGLGADGTYSVQKAKQIGGQERFVNASLTSVFESVQTQFR